MVVKAYIKRDPLEDLAPVEACLSRMAKALDTRSCPNVLPYQRWLQSNVSARASQGVRKTGGGNGVLREGGQKQSVGGRWDKHYENCCQERGLGSIHTTYRI